MALLKILFSLIRVLLCMVLLASTCMLLSPFILIGYVAGYLAEKAADLCGWIGGTKKCG